MSGPRGAGEDGFLARAFAPREVFFTWGGRFRFVRLSAWVQKLAAGSALAAAVLLVAWGSLATLGNVLDKEDLAAKRLEIVHRSRTNAALDRQLRETLARRVVLEARIAALDQGRSRELAGRLALRDQRNSMALRIGELQYRLTDLQRSEQDVIERLSEQARAESRMVERTIAMTGLDSDRLIAGVMSARSGPDDPDAPAVELEIAKLKSADRAPAEPEVADLEPAGYGAEDLDLGWLGKGGPYIPAGMPGAGPGQDIGPDYSQGLMAGEDAEPGGKLAVLLARLDARLERWSALRQAVRHLPLAIPLDQYRISSAYGRRQDPLTKRHARHLGVDFVAPFGTPIRATAPGVVVFAGQHGRYGRMIEIDHGHGLRTRYAHLRKILVKDGQQIGHRQQIGLLGSSGRSTGPHLHYEVRFDGQAQNPMKYILAGQYLLKD